MARTDLLHGMVRGALPLALLALPASAIGQAAPELAASGLNDLRAGSLEIPLNKSQVVRTDSPINKAMIGNAEIADVLPLTDRSVYVLGKKMGTTSLTLYDKSGRVLAVLDLSIGPDVQAFEDQVHRLIPGSNIKGSISGDSMVLTGLAKDPGEIDKAVQLAKTFSDKVVNLVGVGGSQQVMLDVTFAEVRRSVGDNVGVRGLVSSGDQTFNAAIGPGASASTTYDANTGQATTRFGLSGITNSFGVFGKTFTALGLNFESYLNVLENKGYAKILAKPTLVALSGEKASFLAGGEFPVPVAQGSNVGSGGNVPISVQFKPFGVSLGFVPTVLGDKTISLKVTPEVSSIDVANSYSANGITIPGVQTRRASTTLELRDGESFAIAGLLQQDFQTTINQVPLLGSIPIIGALFRSTEFKKGETELMIVVTPHLVAPIKPEQVKLPTDRVEDPTAAKTILMGQDYEPKQSSEMGKGAAKDGDQKKDDGYAY